MATGDRERSPGLDLVALLGASENEVVALAELHRNPRVHIVGLYDPVAEAVGHELAEILGLRHGSDQDFLEQIASAPTIVLPRHHHRFDPAIAFLRERGVTFIDQDTALNRYMVERRVEHPPIPELPLPPRHEAGQLEESLGWLEKALDREALLRSMLSIAVQAVDADKGSIQLFDPFTQQLYIAYADGLSDLTVRSARQCLGEGIAGRVAQSRRAELLQGSDLGPELRDRPDIQSAICAPLEDTGDLLGVVNVSTDHGSRHLNEADLERLVRMSSRISPVLRRLLQIQTLLDRALVEDLERELDGLLDMDPPVNEALALARDLVQDASGARDAGLIVVGEDGPAFQIHAGRNEDGEPITSRTLDPSQGILGQVILDRSPVVLEEKNRRAGETRIRREMTLYVPLGNQETFCVLLLRFSGLSTLSHFQRNLDRLRDVLTPRLGTILSRHETHGRHERLRRLAEGLGALVTTAPEERLGRAAMLFMELSGAEAVAIWRRGSDEPDTELRQSLVTAVGLDAAWERIRERARKGGLQRIRELDPAGSDLRSLLMIGEGGGSLLAAINRRPEDQLAEWGFREEDLEHASLLLEATSDVAAPSTMRDPGPPPAEPLEGRNEPEMGERILIEAVERELDRAQRYHLGFSLSVFHVQIEPVEFEGIDLELRQHVERASRATDAVLWLSEQRVAILAPEEMRGQRRLVRRVQELLESYLSLHLGSDEDRIVVRSAAYPRDVHDAESMIARCLPERGNGSAGDEPADD